MRHLRAIASVLVWPCDWHHPGDDECFSVEWVPGADMELVWRWAERLPRRLWGVARDWADHLPGRNT